MAEPVAELQLSDYLDIARRRKWIIIAIAVVALAAAVAASALQTPLYRADTNQKKGAATVAGSFSTADPFMGNFLVRNAVGGGGTLVPEPTGALTFGAGFLVFGLAMTRRRASL